MERFNHHMMMLARDSRDLSQSELADQLGVGQGTISKFEGGISLPPQEFVEDISRVLKYKSAFFYEEGRPYGMPPFHYRKRKKLSKRALARIVAEMNIRRLHIFKLMRSFEQRTNGFIPEIDRDEYLGKSRAAFSIEGLARQMRETWMLPNGPIPNMIELIENVGGVVVQCDFGTDLIDAMSQRVDGLPVLFFVNANSPTDRMRHTLAHELGHMLMHTLTLKDDEEMEDEADAFAGAFLLPASEIRPQLRTFDLRQLASLKSYWKVSMAAIAVRADRLGLISIYQRKMFWMEMSRLGYRKREPNEPPKEFPSLLRQMVDFHQHQLGYTASEIATLLHLNLDEFEVMYRPEIIGEAENRNSRSVFLRIVK